MIRPAGYVPTDRPRTLAGSAFCFLGAIKKLKRVACYVDGFNLYHGIDELRRPHLKWVNLWNLAESLTRPNFEQLVSVQYFSAFATWRPGQYARHRAYVAALKWAGVTPTIAHFKEKYRKCYHCNRGWKDHEEKETDVRLALAILSDAVDDIYDRAIIISGDSDLVPALLSVRARFPSKTMLVAAPPKRLGSSRDLCKAANSKIEITPGRLAKSLLPNQVRDNDGQVLFTRPTDYDPPR